MKILVEPSAHGMVNVGDAGMLQVASRRLRKLWPHASIGVITEVPERLAGLCPDTTPVPAGGRRLWLETPNLSATLYQRLPSAAARGLRTAEQAVRVRWPSVTSATIRFRRRSKALGSAELDEFLDWLYSADLVVVSGAGLLADPFAPRACTVLELLETAVRRGAATAMFGQGVGPLGDARLKAAARRVLPRVDLIGLREERASRPILRSLGVADRQLVTTGDDAIELAFEAGGSSLGSGIGVGVRVARYSGATNRAVAAIARAVRRAATHHRAELVPVPISSYIKERDATVIAQVIGVDEGMVPELDSPAAVIDQVQRCRVVVSGSYHGAVFALAQGIPAVGLAGTGYYVHKFDGLAELFGGGCTSVALDQPALEDRLEAAIEDAWGSAPAMAPKLLAAAERQLEAGMEAYRRLRCILSRRDVEFVRGGRGK